MNAKETFRTMLAWGTEEPNKELLLAIIDSGICPVQFPDFKQEDCRPLKDNERGNACVLCWYEALYDEKLDGQDMF